LEVAKGLHYSHGIYELEAAGGWRLGAFQAVSALPLGGIDLAAAQRRGLEDPLGAEAGFVIGLAQGRALPRGRIGVMVGGHMINLLIWSRLDWVNLTAQTLPVAHGLSETPKVPK
jgi:uncharacterized membrane protein